MTDYNDGKWHGWNGGECPVDPEAEVQAVRGSPSDATVVTWLAKDFQQSNWMEVGNQYSIIAFRVTKPAAPKAREWWTTSQIMHPTKERAEAFRDQLLAENPGMDFPPIVHVIEKLP